MLKPLKQPSALKSLLLLLLAVTLLSLSKSLPGNLISPAQPLAEESKSFENKNLVTHFVKRVIDGDTIELEDGTKVRYIGIDTPESVKPGNPVECYALASKQRNEELVLAKNVVLEMDVSETDRYGRLLRYVWVDDILVNKALVEEGFAQAVSYPPDVMYQDMFNEAQRRAKDRSLGLWSDVCSEYFNENLDISIESES